MGPVHTVRVATYRQIIVCYWLFLAGSGSFKKQDLLRARRTLRIRKPPFFPLNYGDKLRFRIFDLGLRISNAECEKDSELFYRDDSRSDAAIAHSFSASFALDGTRENGIMNCFVMT